MHKKKGNVRRAATIVIVLALLFNSVGSLFAATTLVRQAQFFANQDAMLICTGKTFKWISLQAYEKTGKVEYIDPPNGAPDNLTHLKCAYTYFAESSSDDELVGYSAPTIGQCLVQFLPECHEFFIAKPKHQFTLARAPPYVS